MGLIDKFVEGMRGKLKSDINEMLKNDADKLPDTSTLENNPNNNKIGRKAIIDDPFFDNVNQHFIFKNKLSRISHKMLKDTSVRDWLVSAIIQARSDTLLRFSRGPEKQFDMGFKFVKRGDSSKLTNEDNENIANLTDFIYHCGRKKDTPPGDEMLFGDFLRVTVRDALTFGHVAVEKVLTRRGGLHRFRPIPSESMYLINKKTKREIIEKEIENAERMRDRHQQYLGDNDPAGEHQNNEPDIDYYKYVQMSYDNRVLSAFGDQDMIWRLFNPQNFSDSNGYCYSPLELAIINVTNHLNVESYNSNFFTHGYAAKGILHLKGTVTQSQMTAFRRQFYNTISGAQHAWRTPIIAGMDDVQWVSLAGNAKEMEYLTFNQHLMRALCTQFQIDPVELGLDMLGSGANKPASNQANNEFKINYSRERGLYPILMFFEDMINCDIVPKLDPKLAELYEFKFVGYTDETPQTNVALLQAEMTVHASMNDLLKSAGKQAMKQDGTDLPLNEAFWGLVEKNFTRGEIREQFFGDKGAASRRELQYIPADPAFMGWQQYIMTLDRARKQDEQAAQQMQMEQQQQQQEADAQSKQDAREQEQHELGVAEAKSRHASAAVGQRSVKDLGKDVGFASRPLEVGGKKVSNPINTESEDV